MSDPENPQEEAPESRGRPVIQIANNFFFVVVFVAIAIAAVVFFVNH